MGIVGNKWLFDGGAEELGTLPIAASSSGTTGQIKYWDGSAWTAKPLKVWTGSAWVTKPLKRWDGASWVVTNY